MSDEGERVWRWLLEAKATKMSHSEWLDLMEKLLQVWVLMPEGERQEIERRSAALGEHREMHQ